MLCAHITLVSVFASEKTQQGQMFYSSLLCGDAFCEPNLHTAAHHEADRESMHAAKLCEFFVWFQYHCWPADRLRINHADSACSATQRSSTTSDENKR